MLLMGNPYQGNLAAIAAVNTFMASAGGCISAMILRTVHVMRTTNNMVFDLTAAMNGTLTGLVAVSSRYSNCNCQSKCGDKAMSSQRCVVLPIHRSLLGVELCSLGLL